jgi:hypothetical protein
MDSTGDFLQRTQLDLVLGAMAFVFQACHIVLVFSVFSSLIIKQSCPGTRLLALSFIVGFLTYALWMIYVWPLRNLFMITALSLAALSYIIFLIQIVLRYAKTKVEGLRSG